MNNKIANHNSTGEKKRFPPIFFIAFALLIVFNVSVFFDYQKPLERYQKFAKVAHQITIKGGEAFNDIERDGEVLPKCTVVNDGTLQWLSFKGQYTYYSFTPLLGATPGKSNENAICQVGDKITIDTSNEKNANTLLVLLSIDFDKPF
jgi:hypothetical protein